MPPTAVLLNALYWHKKMDYSKLKYWSKSVYVLGHINAAWP